MVQIDRSPHGGHALPIESAETLQTAFVRTAGHELRSLLSIVQGYAELFCDGQLGPVAQTQQDVLKVMVQHLYELRRLMERITLLLSIDPEPLVLTSVLQAVIARQKPLAVQAGLSLEAFLAADLPFVVGDGEQLALVVECLLDDAIRFTPAGGTIAVRTEADSTWVSITVQDSGAGISLDHWERLFNGFRGCRGSGLELVLAKAVVAGHQGGIDIETPISGGNVLRIRLPVFKGMRRGGDGRHFFAMNSPAKSARRTPAHPALINRPQRWGQR